MPDRPLVGDNETQELFMPPIELFVAQLCPYAHRVRLALAEKGLQATEIEIDLRNKPAWFLKLTPTGKVPLLRHQGQYVRESAIICEYLDDAFPERPIFPRDAHARAEARIWISFADTQLYARTATMMHSSDAMVHERIKAQLADALRFVEQHAFARRGADERFLLGSEFSAADIAFYPWFEQLCVLEKYLGFVMPTECERLLRWQETVAAREAVRTCARSTGFYLESYGRLLAA
ncbi:glutathione S-transferase family protein [Mesorhizobium sp. LSHC412B00]|uniref:glutathione S-transferase family protein n=1 Tax=unclassified Mesorhizobium TaxID=325217 RepID=UPI00067EBF34|nr:glutathione S-transferase family protein [Mesorhizobium sp. LSHC412B00]